RDREARALADADKMVGEYQAWVDDAVGRFTAAADGLFTDEMLSGPNGAVIQPVRQGLNNVGDELDTRFREASGALARAKDQVTAAAQELKTHHGKQELAFRDLMTKFKEAQGQATERAQWERKRNDLLDKQRRHAELKGKLDRMQAERRV